MGSAGLSSPNELVLLHLSDIHFRQPYCLDRSTDQEHVVRQALLNDLQEMKSIVRHIDVVLVTGDIAFQGHPDEYTSAKEWLHEVAEVCGCNVASIYTVPGNHDVDRSATKNADVVSTRDVIMRTPIKSGRDKKLHDAVLNDESAITLLSPLANYNVFAAAFKCNASQMPFWKDSLYLAPGWELDIHGLNSCLFSGPDDVRGKLYLGTLQSVFPKCDGVVRLAMLHHPPEWLEDYDTIDDRLSSGCEIQLLGHKHRSRYLASETAVRYSAGAVNPSRAEGAWEPGYNVIKLNVAERGGEHFLEVESHLRLWQSAPDRFVPKKTLNGKEVFVHSINLHRKPAQHADSASFTTTEAEVSVSTTEKPMENLTRELVLKFWSLSTSQRWLIVKGLQLLEEEDIKLPEPLRYERAFERARALGKIGELAAKISEL